MTYIHVLFSKGGFFDALYKVYDLTGDMDGEAVNERMDQLRMGKKRAQDNGTAEPTGPPVERYSYDGIPKENTDIPYQLYRKLINKQPISVSRKDLAKVSDTRVTRYRGLSTEDIPDIDFLAVAEYNKVNEGYVYTVRNYGKDEFVIIRRMRIRNEYRSYISEVSKNERDRETDSTGAESPRAGNERHRNDYRLSGNEGTYANHAPRSDEASDDQSKHRFSIGSTDSGRGYSVSDSAKNHQDKFSYAGENAKTADLDALERAKEMQAAGVADETIRQETGWFVGMDGKWRWEIDDSEML